jgi:NlpC/P60 family putative phage cell wall peptidase
MLSIPREHIVAIARSWRGTPYHHQQSSKHYGTDCLGLVRGVWRELYGREPEIPPPYTRDWAEGSRFETLLEAARRHFVEINKKNAREGDVLVFRYRRDVPAKHLGILVTPNRIIHAIEGAPVSEFNISLWWRRRIDTAFSFPGVGPPRADDDA